MKNKIDDLRNHLFAALEGLADQDKPMEIERAKAIADVARVVVESAKAEVQYLVATGQMRGTGFITLPEGDMIPARPRLAGSSSRAATG